MKGSRSDGEAQKADANPRVRVGIAFFGVSMKDRLIATGGGEGMRSEG